MIIKFIKDLNCSCIPGYRNGGALVSEIDGNRGKSWNKRSANNQLKVRFVDPCKSNLSGSRAFETK